jgi:L-ribulose-5-phosphate 3-epimerase
MAEGRSLRERLELVAAFGFEGVDVVAPGGPDLAELRAASRETGVALPTVLAGRSLEWPLAHPDPATRNHGREGLESSLRAAAEIGASSVLFPAILAPGLAAEEGWALALPELRRTLPLAEELGVTLGIENVGDGFARSAEELVLLLDELGSPAAAVHFDVGNALTVGSPAAWIRELAERIVKVDLKDFDRERARGNGLQHGLDVPLGSGDCDWPAVAEALRAIGYDGWLSVETPGSGSAFLASIAGMLEAILA